MSVESKVEKLENAKVKLTIDITASDVNQGFDKAYKKIGAKVKLPGFRPGKVPKSILKQRYEDTVKNEAFEEILNQAIETAIVKDKLNIVSSPDIENVTDVYTKLQENESLSFQAVLEVYPTVELGPYKDLTVTAKTFYYDASHVDLELKKLQDREAEVIKKENDTAETDDLLQIQCNFYLVAKDEDNNLLRHINLNGNDEWFGPHQDQLLGMKVGDEKDFGMKIPEDYGVEALEGKDGYVHVKILEINYIDLPDMDDELAKDYNFDTLDDLKKDIETKLEETVNQKKREETFSALVEEIITNSQFDMGEAVVENRINQNLRTMQKQLEKMNVSLEHYLAMIRKSLDEIKDEMRESSLKDIQFDLIRQSVIEKEKIEVTDEDMDLEYKRYADHAKIPFEEAKKALSQNTTLDTLEYGRLHNKLIDFLIEHNTAKDGEKEAIQINS